MRTCLVLAGRAQVYLGRLGGHERVWPLLLFHLGNSAPAGLQVPTDFGGREEGGTGRTSATHL